nr:MAG TPA: hypothetical protein [Caudoviricetes sp.]
MLISLLSVFFLQSTLIYLIVNNWNFSPESAKDKNKTEIRLKYLLDKTCQVCYNRMRIKF